jgi:hypothetical protein
MADQDVRISTRTMRDMPPLSSSMPYNKSTKFEEANQLPESSPPPPTPFHICIPISHPKRGTQTPHSTNQERKKKLTSLTIPLPSSRARDQMRDTLRDSTANIRAAGVLDPAFDLVVFVGWEVARAGECDAGECAGHGCVMWKQKANMGGLRWAGRMRTS